MRLHILLAASLVSAYATVPVSHPGSRRNLNLGGRRDKRDGQRDIASAVDVASKIVSDGSTIGFFFRGDSRGPEEIFSTGFVPQGTDMDLQHHLSFAGNSGYVSVSRSRPAASRYAYGRTGSLSRTGHVYVIRPLGVPDGHWVPGIYPSDGAVQRNQEFAVMGTIPASEIAGAYVFEDGNRGAPVRWEPNPSYAGRVTHPYDPSHDSCFRKFCRAVSDIGRRWVCGGARPSCAHEAKVCSSGQSDAECQDGASYSYHESPSSSRETIDDISPEIERIYLQGLQDQGPGATAASSTATADATSTAPPSGSFIAATFQRLSEGRFEGLQCSLMLNVAKALLAKHSRPKRRTSELSAAAQNDSDAFMRRQECKKAREIWTKLAERRAASAAKSKKHTHDEFR